jgi:hypothetical protein
VTPFLCNQAKVISQRLTPLIPTRRKLSTKSLPACRFGRSAKRTRHILRIDVAREMGHARLY